MPPMIRVLDEQTINKIAAGEVIENPASVVKELVDNSLDAMASQIVVEIVSGGRQLIRVSDNGCGMGKEDALLSLQRHATSKLTNVEALAHLSTMGFRGEAIPSIASISHLTIITSMHDAPDAGTIVSVEGGEVVYCGSTTASKGTSIEVKSLFYNVPVRRKFQKSIAYDNAEVLKTVGMLALANPQVHFQLISNQNIVLSTQGTPCSDPDEALKLRIADILGKEDEYFSIPIHIQEGDLQLKGWIGPPSNHRPNRSGQYLFINQRPVFSPLISSAASEGYGTLLPPRRFPVFALHLTLPGSLVDVNVHPQKKEVRLRSSHTLYQTISRSIERALYPSQTVPDFNSTPLTFSEELFQRQDSLTPTLPWEEPVFTEQTIEENSWTPPKKPVQEEPSLPLTQIYPKILGIWPPYIFVDPLSLPSLPDSLDSSGGLLIIDQQLAHRRVLYENCLKDAYSVDSQALLVPIHLDFSPAEADFLNEYLPDLNQIGISIRSFGKQSFIIDSMPSALAESDVQALMLEIIGSLHQFSKESHLKKQKNKQAALAASKAAIFKNTQLSVQEAEELIKQLFACSNPLQCPQGKTIVAILKPDELKKKFQ